PAGQCQPKLAWTKEMSRRHPVELEDIESLRRREDIDDVELRAEIRNLQVGDCVKLTFQIGAKSLAGETLSVRITSIQGSTFRGKLAEAPSFSGLSRLRAGSRVEFTTSHIHSIRKQQPKQEQ